MASVIARTNQGLSPMPFQSAVNVRVAMPKTGPAGRATLTVRSRK